jgi:hypothetical protein
MPSVFRTFMIVAALLTLTLLAAELYCRYAPGLNHVPYNRPTLVASDDYADFRMFPDRFKHFHHRDFFTTQSGGHFLYPATIGMLYEPFLFLPYRHLPILFMVVLLLLELGLGVYFRQILIRRGLSVSSATLFASIATLTSYPLYFELNRANVEIFIWIIAGAGVIALVRNRPWWAATLFGIAGSFKFYPFIYTGLLIARKQYKQAAWAFCAGGLFTIFSLWAITGSISTSQTGSTAGLNEFRVVYILHKRPGEIGLDHSIVGIYKRFVPHMPSPDQLGHQISIYLAIVTVIGCVAYFARAMKLPFINQVIFLTVAAIVLPPVSYDYTLLHLYTPFMLMVFLAIDFWKRGLELPKGAWPAFICFMVLLAPLNELILHGERVEGQIKCLVLLALAVISLTYRFVSEEAISPLRAVA